MRLGMFMAALLATATFGSVALADRNNDDESKQGRRGRTIKEQVLEKQRHAPQERASRATSSTGAKGKAPGLESKLTPRGEVYSDQASASGRRSSASNGGRNLSASNAVNTPREIKAMKQMINPMNGAYRVSQAAEGTDSYGGSSMVPHEHGRGGKNLSATGLVSTPKEIDRMMGMLGKSQGSRCAAGGGTDSYGGARTWAPYSASQGRTHSYSVDAQGNVKGVVDKAKIDRAKGKELREKINRRISDRLSKAKEKRDS